MLIRLWILENFKPHAGDKMKRHSGSPFMAIHRPPTQLPSLPSSHTAVCLIMNWTCNNPSDTKMVELHAKRTVEIVALHLQSQLDSWDEVGHEACQLLGHAMVVLMNRFGVLMATLTFPITQSHSSYQGPRTPCNHFHLSFPQIHIDRNSRPWRAVQPFVD